MDRKVIPVAANWQELLSTPVQFNRPAPQQKKKSFWLDQLSTLGGIGGGILGSAVAPIVGTAGGAGAGSALGEAIENLITGDSMTKNLAKEGALGAVFGAGPLKLLKGAGAGAKALATGADDVVGAASKAALTPLRRSAGKAITGAADNLAIKQFRLTPTQLTNFQKKFGEDAGQVIRKYGFQSVDDIATKGIEPIQQQFDEAITGIAGVTKESLKKNLTKRIGTLSKAGPSDTKAIGAQLKKEANDLLKPFGDVIDAKELNVIRRQFDDLVNYTERASNPARYGVNKRMADAIRETLQQADQTGGLKGLGRELNKLRQLADAASRQGNLGRGSLPLGLNNLMGGGVGGIAGGPGGALGGVLTAQAINSPTGRRALMSGAEKIGGRLAKSGSTSQTPLGIAGRVGAAGMLGGVDQSLPNNNANISANPTTSDPMMNPAIMDESYNETPSQASTSPFAPENIESNIQAIVASGGKMTDVMEYIKVAEAINKLTGGNSASNLSQSSKNALASSDNAINTVDQLEQLFTSAGSGSGRLGGTIKGWAANAGFDEDAKIYTSLANASVTQIAKALAGSGAGTVSDMDAKVIMAALPTLRDTPAEARAKFAALKQRLENAKNNSLIYGGGTTPEQPASLEDALMQYTQ